MTSKTFKIATNFFTIICILFLQGCLFSSKLTIRGREGSLRLKQVDFEDLNGWSEQNQKQSLQALLHSCNKFAKMAQNRQIGGKIGDIIAADFRDVCEIANIVKTMSAKQTQNFFQNWFKPFLVQNGSRNSNGLFTGYYEASLNGSRVKTEKFKYPLYARPKDLTSAPYLTRAEIEGGALKDKALELLYVDDKAELFFLHIQGSGRITMPDGTVVRVSFAGRNNQKFTGIGNYMADKSLIERNNISADGIKNWIRQNPDQADEVMNYNPAYTFFKFTEGEYVIGGQGVPLTPEVSLAVDSEIIPYGFPLWVETTLKDKNTPAEKFNRLMIAQDTGSAIKGAVRGDIFFGYGKEAERKASALASSGEYYILLPINVVDKLR